MSSFLPLLFLFQTLAASSKKEAEALVWFAFFIVMSNHWGQKQHGGERGGFILYVCVTVHNFITEVSLGGSSSDTTKKCCLLASCHWPTHSAFSSSLSFYILCVSMHVCRYDIQMYVCVTGTCLAPLEIRRRHWIPWNRTYGQL